jgi:type II secretory ATPase GspE/PulE/Tfp pilus assembly ATPase PilB-like protein
MKRRIQRREPIEEIRRQAMKDGMTTLLQDGIHKVDSAAPRTSSRCEPSA